jgi:predicted Zn-dependent peptidase
MIGIHIFPESQPMQLTVLPNGLRVVTESLPFFDSVNTSVYIRAGSRDEADDEHGVAHFLEHMAFKGTSKRTAYDISREIEELGSRINAFTSKNTTCFYVNSLGKHVRSSLDILSDVLLNSVFATKEIDVERGVILQEMAMYNDDAWDVSNEALMRSFYPNDTIGRAILGDPAFIKSATTESFKSFIGRHYTGPNMLVIAVGNVVHEEFVAMVAEYFRTIPNGTVNARKEPVYGGGDFVTITDKPFEQVVVRMGWPVPAFARSGSDAAEVMASAFCSGMSSPVFQEIREKRGLVYTVGGYANPGVDHGEAVISGGMTPENVKEYVTVLRDLLANASSVITERDVQRAKNAMLVEVATLKEKLGSLSMTIAHDLFSLGHYLTPEDRARLIEAVTLDEVHEQARVMLSNDPTVVLVGPLDDELVRALKA